MTDRRGTDVLLEVLATEGVTHVFGNPGTTELPLVDALAEVESPRYVLALQEATVVGMADGYAQASGRPAFVNLHTSAGLGNAIGNLTNAQANGTPLVVTAGQQDWRHIHTDPLLAGELVSLAAPVSKWSHEVRTLDELGTMVRRAFHDAGSAPAGPVFLSLPMDLLDRTGAPPPPPPSRLERATVAPCLDELADLLATTDPDRVALVAGDEVAASGGVGALVRVAELLGARVHGAPIHSTVVFPTAHPLWAGPLPPAAAAVRAALDGCERVLLVGGRAFMAYPYTEGAPLPQGTELLHLSPDPAQLGRVWPVRLGLVGDPRASLQRLASLLDPIVDHDRAARRLREAAERRDDAWSRYDDGARQRYGQVPMAPAAAVHALLSGLPRGVTVVDEAITTGTYVRGFHRTEEPGRYFFCRGGGLGWAMPAALGVSLARDGEPVLCVVGDGSAMYSPQALWTAAREHLPVLFAVVDNRQYLILKNALRSRGGATARTGRYVGMDLDDPALDFVALARSMGVEGILVEKAADVGDAARAAWESGRPQVLHLPIAAPA